jgi:hypothetical protein
VFWELRIIFNAIYDDGFAESKALITISCVEMAILLILLAAISVHAGHKLLPASKAVAILMIIGLACAIMATNQFFLTYKNKWTRFEPEFKGYSLHARTIGGVFVVAAAILAVVGMIISLGVARQLPP